MGETINNHERSARENELKRAKEELAQKHSEDRRQLELVRSSESLLKLVGEVHGKLSAEYQQTRVLYLLLADARGEVSNSITRIRTHIEAMENALAEGSGE